MRQKTWKKRLALVLAASMTLNMGLMTSFAEWRKDGDKWYYYKEDGTRVEGKVKQIKGEWYSFDENGVMETDKLINEGGGTFYISPAGQLLEKRWALLENGKKPSGDGGDWYYFGDIESADGKITGGGMVKDELKMIRDKWYSFDQETGIMRSNQWVKIMREGSERTLYANPDGDLATGWKYLSKDGKACNHNTEDCDCHWYYFKSFGEDNDDKGARIENKDKRGIGPEDKREYYAFDEEGQMLSRQWWENEKGERTHYYQYRGEMAAGKWLPLEEANGKILWYRFDADGNVIETQTEAEATASDADRKVVRSVKPIGATDVRDVVIGETVTLEFQIATSSNAQRGSDSFSGDHDVWVSNVKQGRTKYVGIDGDVCTIQYWNNNEGSEEIYLYVDGTKSTGSFKVHTAAPAKNDDNAVDKVLDNIDNIDEITDDKEKAEVATQVKVAYEAASDEKKEELQDKWLKDPDNLGKLEEAYAKANKLPEPKKNVTDGAKETLGLKADDDVMITMVGGNLNAANPGDAVSLELDAPKEGWKEKLKNDENTVVIKEDTVTVALDLTFLLNNNRQTQLKVPVVITMPLPASVKEALENNMSMELFNIHENGIHPVNFEVVGDGEIKFVTDKFSTYVFVMNSTPDDNPTPGGYSGGRSSGGSRQASNNAIAGTLAGQWMQDGTGWWFRLDDGSYAVDSWQYVAYNGMAKWYRFDINGYICKGWFTDADGHRYYLNPVSDGQMGAMLTGWQQIDGIWYYFNTVSDGTQGALLVNTTTPDGYNVDANGQWIQ